MKERDEFEMFIQGQVEGKEEQPLRSVWNEIEAELPKKGWGFHTPLIFIALAFCSIIVIWSFNLIKGKNILGHEVNALNMQNISERLPSYMLFPSFQRARASALASKRPLFSFLVNDEEEKENLMEIILQYFKADSYALDHWATQFVWSVDLKSNKKRMEQKLSQSIIFQTFSHNGNTLTAEKKILMEQMDVKEVHSILMNEMQKNRQKIENGEKLYSLNCEGCHANDMKENSTGPALGGITSKRNKEWLYDFTRNSQKMIEQGDRLALDIDTKWKNATMNDFPELTDEQLDDLYYYVEHVHYNTSPSLHHRVGGGDVYYSGDEDDFKIDETGPIDSLSIEGIHYQDTMQGVLLNEN